MKILALPYTHTLSHLTRVLAVAIELRRLGHEVVFAGDSPKTSFITNAGFDVLPYHEPDPDTLFGNIRAGKLRFVDESEVLRMLEADLSVIRNVNPDMVLSDGRFTAALSTHVARVRHAAIVNVSSTEFRSLPYIPFFGWVPQWAVSRTSMLWGLLDRLNLFAEMTMFDTVMNVFTKLSHKFNLSRPVTATNCLAGKDITLLADIPEYFPTRDLPSTYYYVGPLTWKAEISPPEWWPPPRGPEPLVYITMGTTGVSEIFSAMARILGNAPFRSIVTTGGQSADLQSIPGKVYLEKYIDGDLVMKQSDLVVCHGGNGTIYQALSNEKPILGIPTIPDQSFNMRRVEALGVGKSLELRDFLKNPNIIYSAINDILQNESYKQCVQNIKTVLDNYNAARMSAEILLKTP